MSNRIKKSPGLVLLVLVVFGFIAGWFYWFEWRPNEIKKACYQQVYAKSLGDLSAFGRDAVERQQQDLRYEYNSCLQSKGLE